MCSQNAHLGATAVLASYSTGGIVEGQVPRFPILAGCGKTRVEGG
jgi:hypothetical protein